jgi:hypothetical protein
MEHRYISDLTRRALTWGAWAVVVVSVVGGSLPF